MKKRSKKYTQALKSFDTTKSYDLKKACEIIKKVNYAKFDGSVDLAVRLGIDPKQSNQMVRGVVALPHGIGKKVRVLVLTGADKVKDALNAGADYAGLDEYIQKIETGWTDIDVIVCSPDVMPKVGKLGKVLGPRGLMPNPKSGTVTADVAKAVKEVKAGKIDFKVDKNGIIHASIGKSSFAADQLHDNALELLNVIQRLKPQGLKDTYFKSIYLSTTMSPSVEVEKSTVAGL